MLVDASFLLAVADQDRSATRFASLLGRSVTTSVNFGEVLYKLDQKAGMPAARTESVFRGLGVTVEPVGIETARLFADLKHIDAAARAAQSAAGASSIKTLSLADMCCLGYALATNMPVLTGDKHWLSLSSSGLTLSVFDYRDLTVSL